MAIGVVGKKSGMTRLFAEEGTSVPVTVISVEPNRVTQIKTPESDGYHAVQITTGSAKPESCLKTDGRALCEGQGYRRQRIVGIPAQ